MQSDRITIYNDLDFTIELEFNKDYVIWHTPRVDRFSLAVYRRMKAFSDQLEQFLKLHYNCLYTYIPPGRRDLYRLASHGGFYQFDAPKPDGAVVMRKDWKD